MEPRTKYPRTFHLPWSPGATDDDKTLSDVEHFQGERVLVTEKLDGENTTIYPDGYLHARSVDGRAHESQNWVRALAASVAPDLPKGWRVCGENLFAQHSIHYDALGSYFYVFAMYDEEDRCLSWEETMEWAALLGLETAPALYEGPWDEDAVKACFSGVSRLGGEQEGYVVRVAESFRYAEFPRKVAKFVRANHVPVGDKHWRAKAVTPNRLRLTSQAG